MSEDEVERIRRTTYQSLEAIAAIMFVALVVAVMM